MSFRSVNELLRRLGLAEIDLYREGLDVIFFFEFLGQNDGLGRRSLCCVVDDDVGASAGEMLCADSTEALDLVSVIKVRRCKYQLVLVIGETYEIDQSYFAKPQ